MSQLGLWGPGQRLRPPCSYQGGKQAIAHRIADRIEREGRDRPFVEVCCGTGAVSLALVENGRKPDTITMIDAGPWGEFWRQIGDGSFDWPLFQQRIAAIPTDRYAVHDHVVELAKLTTPPDPTAFLILQAASFGSKPVGIRKGWDTRSGVRIVTSDTMDNGQSFPLAPSAGELERRDAALGGWDHAGFYNHADGVDADMRPGPEERALRVARVSGWEHAGFKECLETDPTPERHLALAPSAPELLRRTHQVTSMRGVRGLFMDASTFEPAPGSVIYIDPDYKGTSGYAHSFDAETYARLWVARGCVVLVSEKRALSPEAELVRKAPRRGSVSGGSDGRQDEWLSYFR